MTKDEALRFALDALETSMYPQQKQLQAITAIEQALAAPVQEPVAWMWSHKTAGNVGVYFEEPAKFFDLTKPSDYDWTPLYTTPPAAKQDIQRLSALVRAQQITIDKLEAAQPAVPDAFGTREGEHPQYIQGWNDCRAEMLQEFKEKQT